MFQKQNAILIILLTFEVSVLYSTHHQKRSGFSPRTDSVFHPFLYRSLDMGPWFVSFLSTPRLEEVRI